ncbi:MAG: hypothetical protein RBS31_02185 [Candidatus Syntrophosphaera sp.]|nr:hypothetical protein [Candidatus Cloacimonadota bacterium]MDX9949271.1 hypothetical protein [Candidatus Syntrophosphaera sp.]
MQYDKIDSFLVAAFSLPYVLKGKYKVDKDLGLCGAFYNRLVLIYWSLKVLFGDLIFLELLKTVTITRARVSDSR